MTRHVVSRLARPQARVISSLLGAKNERWSRFQREGELCPWAFVTGRKKEEPPREQICLWGELNRLFAVSLTAFAEELGVSYNTIKFHMRHVYEKLQVHSKSEAVSKALQNRLV